MTLCELGESDPMNPSATLRDCNQQKPFVQGRFRDRSWSPSDWLLGAVMAMAAVGAGRPVELR
jgi:hypothetical protein